MTYVRMNSASVRHVGIVSRILCDYTFGIAVARDGFCYGDGQYLAIREGKAHFLLWLACEECKECAFRCSRGTSTRRYSCAEREEILR